MATTLETTNTKDQQLAKKTFISLKEGRKRYMSGRASNIKIKIYKEAEFVSIPKKAFVLLFDILENMAEGKSVKILASSTEISTQKAAELLNVSRPHIVSLLESGKIPFTLVGTHRRIKLKDFLNYKASIDAKRKTNLAFLAKQAQELNLGY
jgi:excisionase family DNA binding protein